MDAAIISSFTLIREGLSSIISRYGKMEIKVTAETIREVYCKINDNKIDVIFIDINVANEEELTTIKQLKACGVKSKFIIVDFNKNKDIFIKAIKCGVEGYILGKFSEYELLHIVEQICRGKKYYDSYFIDSMINEDNEEPNEIAVLTAREKEILCAIGKGFNNRKISEELFISEHTVKKHINHIFDKLNIRDRTQAALYANKCGIIKDNESYMVV
jgi:two-component system nitrate/nitrite response regulator NarL